MSWSNIMYDQSSPSTDEHEYSEHTWAPAGRDCYEDAPRFSETTTVEPSFSHDFATAVILTAACLSAASEFRDVGPIGSIHWPLYLIGTRDHFTRELVPIREPIVGANGKKFVKTTWCFISGEAPENYHHRYGAVAAEQRAHHLSSLAAGIDNDVASTMLMIMDQVVDSISDSREKDIRQARNPWSYITSKDESGTLIPVGITTYEDLFRPEELEDIETHTDRVERSARAGILPSECYHDSTSKSGNIKRTKFFFGARYLWTRHQMADSYAKVARGVRVDVPDIPHWVLDSVEQQMVMHDVLPKDFVNSIALNMYHDGSEGKYGGIDGAYLLY